ncbi:hypothetical protein VPH35_022342 [Triticum aestivum]
MGAVKKASHTRPNPALHALSIPTRNLSSSRFSSASPPPPLLPLHPYLTENGGDEEGRRLAHTRAPDRGSVLAGPGFPSAPRRRRQGGLGSDSLRGVECAGEVSGNRVAGNWRCFWLWVPATPSRTSEPPPPICFLHVSAPGVTCVLHRLSLLTVVAASACCGSSVFVTVVSASKEFLLQSGIAPNTGVFFLGGRSSFPLLATDFIRAPSPC